MINYDSTLKYIYLDRNKNISQSAQLKFFIMKFKQKRINVQKEERKVKNFIKARNQAMVSIL